jgi:tetratricopeptide (TPR) repeat protein
MHPMTIGTEYSIACQTAVSYFEDINQEIQKLEQQDNYLLKESSGKAIIDGDLQLFHSEIMKSQPHEQPSLLGMYYSCIGRIKELNYFAQIKFGIVNEGIGKNAKKNLSEAAEAFSNAVAADPDPLYQYSLACTYLNLDRKAEAVQMFELVTNGDNSELALQARKTIGRIGPVTSVKPDSSHQSTNNNDWVETDTPIKSNSSSLGDDSRDRNRQHDTPIKANSSSLSDDSRDRNRQQEPEWGEIIKGSCALFFGFALIQLPIIGIPLIIWGGWIVIVYCMKKIDN